MHEFPAPQSFERGYVQRLLKGHRTDELKLDSYTGTMSLTCVNKVVPLRALASRLPKSLKVKRLNSKGHSKRTSFRTAANQQLPGCIRSRLPQSFERGSVQRLLKGHRTDELKLDSYTRTMSLTCVNKVVPLGGISFTPPQILKKLNVKLPNVHKKRTSYRSAAIQQLHRYHVPCVK